MILLAVVVLGVIAVGVAVHKHLSLKQVEADVKSAVANADKAIASSISSSGIVAGIKADLKKYLGI